MMEEDNLSVNSTGSAAPGEEMHNNRACETSMNQPVPLLGGHNKYEWIYLLLCVPNAVILICLSAGVISQRHCIEDYSLHQNPYLRTEVLTCIIAGISIIFVLYGLFAEHQYDLYLHSVMISFALFFSWIGFGMNPSCLKNFNIICNIIAMLLSGICSMLAWKATHVPDWVEFWIIGVSEALTDMYKQVCYFLALLRLDSAFIIIFAVQTVTAVFPDSIYSDNWRWWLGYQFAMTAYAFLSWTLGKLTVIKEDMYLYKSFQVVNTVYLVYLFYQVLTLIQCVARSINSQDTRTAFLYISSIILGIFCMFLKIRMMFKMSKTTKTFGHDLSSQSFSELVSRNSNNLLARTRSDLKF